MVKECTRKNCKWLLKDADAFLYFRSIQYNENEAVNYYEKSFSKVMFDSAGNRNECVERIINGRTKDGINDTTENGKRVYTIILNISFLRTTAVCYRSTLALIS